jgi:hypothetical protein
MFSFQILRHQLSVSQNQLMSLLSDSEPERNQQKKKFKGQFQRQLKQQDKPCDNKVKNLSQRQKSFLGVLGKTT